MQTCSVLEPLMNQKISSFRFWNYNVIKMNIVYGSTSEIDVVCQKTRIFLILLLNSIVVEKRKKELCVSYLLGFSDFTILFELCSANQFCESSFKLVPVFPRKSALLFQILNSKTWNWLRKCIWSLKLMNFFEWYTLFSIEVKFSCFFMVTNY